MIERTKTVRASLERTFAYFSDPVNLPAITPPSLAIRVETARRDPPIFAGCEIKYSIRWLRLPLRWTTLITAFDTPRRFVDAQKRGPYRHWWHEHTFVAAGDDTLMTDRIKYDMPFGVLGAIVDHLIVRRQIAAILDYRERRIDELFPAR